MRRRQLDGVLDVRALVFVMALAAVGCGNSNGTSDGGANDLSASSGKDLVGATSQCGHPGDKGNSIGVGKFCSHVSDCTGNTKANLCAQLGDPNQFFCTFACSATGPANQCGENATCACDPMGRGCGCFPLACAGPPEG